MHTFRFKLFAYNVTTHCPEVYSYGHSLYRTSTYRCVDARRMTRTFEQYAIASGKICDTCVGGCSDRLA